MTHKHYFIIIRNVFLLTLLLVSCEKESKTIDVSFWSAPNITQFNFWSSMAEEFNQSQDLIFVKVDQTPESPSSEAGIISAIASGASPHASENINRGFAEELKNSGVILALNELSFFDDIINERNMSESIKSWQFSDGNQYVLPLYGVPYLQMWRIDILKSLGINDIPETYEDVYSAAQKIQERREVDPDFITEYAYAQINITNPNWWETWFDFLPHYYMNSNGIDFISGSDLIADDEAAKNVFRYFYTLKQMPSGLLGQKDNEPFERGVALSQGGATWNINPLLEKYPDLKYKENWDVSFPPKADKGGINRTFIDSKGIVIYADKNEEESLAIQEFLYWVLKRNDFDEKWFTTTRTPPFRDDLLTNEALKKLFLGSPGIDAFASKISEGFPAMDNSEIAEIQTLVREKGQIPLLTGKINDPDLAWDETKKAIEDLLRD